MAYNYGVKNTDPNFVIDPITRSISQKSGKNKLMQHDHNSECYGFEMPRFIDGHDMSSCDIIIHYINVSSNKSMTSTGAYPVSDVSVVGDNVVFSWLVSRNATGYSGTLNFAISFERKEDESVTYSWHTDIFKNISICETIYDNGTETVEPYSDVLTQWHSMLFGEIEELRAAIDDIGSGEEETIRTVTGRIISVNDALPSAPTVMKMYGRTKQIGTPSVESPIVPTNSMANGLFLYHRGKNMIDVADTTLTHDSSTHIWIDALYKCGIIEGETYTMSVKITSANAATGRAVLVVRDYNSNVIASSAQPKTGDGKLSLTFTATADGRYLQCYMTTPTEGDVFTVTEFQLETGEVATEYEPYDSSKSSVVWIGLTADGLAGIPVTLGGNYRDENGQRWVCDTVDFINGTLETRCATIASYAGESIPGAYISSTGKLTTGATVVYALAEPIITTLDTSAYNSIEFQSPNRTLYGKDWVWLEMEYERDVDISSSTVIVNQSFDPTKYSIDILWLEGDTTGMTKENPVDLTWRYKDKTGTASVKWQGSSSLWFAKKNYTIKFDQAFEVVEGWGEQKKYCLKANFVDPSHARNICCAKLWGKVVKSRSVVPERLANLPNAGAIDGFPIAIMLNDEFHGLYTWNIPKDGWMMGMSTGDREAIVCAEGTTDAKGFKTTIDALDTEYSYEYSLDKNDTDWIVESLNRLITACINSDGTDLDTTIAQYLDWDSAIDSYIFTVLTAGHDNVVRNYLLCTFDGVKWYFSQYDMDSTFGLLGDGPVIKDYFSPTFETNATRHRVYELIKLYKKDALKARYDQLRSRVFSEVGVHGLITTFVNSIPPAVMLADIEKYPTISSATSSNFAQILHYYGLTVKMADEAMAELMAE